MSSHPGLNGSAITRPVDRRRTWDPALSDATTCDVMERVGYAGVQIGADWDPRGCVSSSAESMAWPKSSGVPLSAPIHSFGCRRGDRSERTFGLIGHPLAARAVDRRGDRRAAVAVARKLAVIMHTMLKTGELFDKAHTAASSIKERATI
jgi:hypothetical protein